MMMVMMTMMAMMMKSGHASYVASPMPTAKQGRLGSSVFHVNVGLMKSAQQAINIITAKTVNLMMKFDMIHRPTSHVVLRLKFFKIQII